MRATSARVSPLWEEAEIPSVGKHVRKWLGDCLEPRRQLGAIGSHGGFPGEAVRHSAGRRTDAHLKPMSYTPGVVWVFWCTRAQCIHKYLNPVCEQGSTRGQPGVTPHSIPLYSIF